MSYRITITRGAAKTFRGLHPQVAARLTAAIHELAEDPHPAGSLRLSGGDGELRIRVGDYRVIYDVQEDELVVLVLRVGHRREIYR